MVWCAYVTLVVRGSTVLVLAVIARRWHNTRGHIKTAGAHQTPPRTRGAIIHRTALAPGRQASTAIHTHAAHAHARAGGGGWVSRAPCGLCLDTGWRDPPAVQVSVSLVQCLPLPVQVAHECPYTRVNTTRPSAVCRTWRGGAGWGGVWRGGTVLRALLAVCSSAAADSGCAHTAVCVCVRVRDAALVGEA